MTPDPLELLLPRLLIVDDERQIHASIRLRLAGAYDLEFSFDALEALEKIRERHFDLCIADIHMPKMDGLSFIAAAQQIDPSLGFVVLSAFDTSDNLRRTIPLQVYEFVSKPLPEKSEFEARIPEWIARTRQRRRDQALVSEADSIAADRDSARLEREIELVSAESARDTLRQVAGLLTTIDAHLLSATTWLSSRTRSDPSLLALLRSLVQARKTADAATAITGRFFDSGYGSRVESPALPLEGIPHAVEIAQRIVQAEQSNKTVDLQADASGITLRGITGIDFLMMMVPAIAAALACAPAHTTVGIRCEAIARIESIMKDLRFRGFQWINRKHALASHAGLIIKITCSGRPLNRTDVEAWLQGDCTLLLTIPALGLVNGIRKGQGLLGVSQPPVHSHFALLLVLPT